MAGMTFFTAMSAQPMTPHLTGSVNTYPPLLDRIT
jgi:hypothetical protein